MNTRICKQCNIEKTLGIDFRKHSGNGYEWSCKLCATERSRQYRLNNLEKDKKNKSDYYINNIEKVKEQHRNLRNKEGYYKKKYLLEKNNPFTYKKTLLRKRISASFKVNRWKKNTIAEKVLGCSYQEAINHISLLFVENMSWDNKHKWHIDHIIPLASATTEEELIKLCHYTNLQPLWAEDNLKKGSKLTY